LKFKTPAIRFNGATPYSFYYEDAELVLLTWERDDAKFLFRVEEQSEEEWVLNYPGETFASRVLDAIQSIFFVQVQEEADTPASLYVLGSYFVFQNKVYGAYYPRDGANLEMLLFRLGGEAPAYELEPIEGEEYRAASAYFAQNYA